MVGLTVWVVVLIVVLLCIGMALAGDLPSIPQGGSQGAVQGMGDKAGEIRVRYLPNGLKVLVLENHSAPLVCSYLWYRVGLRNEKPGEAGITHFLEHMAFKGTENLAKREIDRLVTMKGGYLNGFTSMDYTAYVETLPRDALDLAFRVEAERMARCLLAAEDVESEKGVVISELEGAENDPGFLLRRAVMAEQFPGQPYGRPVIGEKEHLRDLTRDKVVSYYGEHYSPSNAVLVVVGDVEAAEAFAKAESFFGSLPPAQVSAPAANPGRGATGEKRVELELPGRTSYLQAVYEVPPIQHPDHVVLEVLQNILSGGRTSRVYRALVDSEIASQAGGWDYENPETTVFAFEMSLRPGVHPKRGEEALDQVLETLAREPVGERELAKAKNQTKAQFIYSSDGVSKLARQIGYYELLIGHDYLRTFPDRVDAITPEDIQRVVSRYFTADNRTVGWLIAVEGEPGGRGATGGAGAGPSDIRLGYRPEPTAGPAEDAAPAPVPAPPGIGAVPTISEFRLDNGMQVILQEDHAAPFVTIYGNLMAGPVFEPPEKSGMAAFAAEMLSHGTEKRTWEEIQEALDFVAAHLGFGIGAQVATIQGQCMRDDLGLLLEAAAEQLMAPSFPPEEIEKVRSLLIAGQESRDEDTLEVAEKVLLESLYPEGHPLHYDSLGTRESVSSISREDLLAFHEQYYRPENTMLAIVGDIDPAEAAALAQRAFGEWEKRGEPARPDLPQVSVPEEPRIVRVPVANKTQVDIAIGFPGISRRDPRYYQADLMNYVLGRGGFMSRMNMDIREELGLAYYVWTHYRAYWGPGPWMLQMGVNPANAEKALAAAIEQIKRIQEEPPSEQELNLWKDYVEGTVARQMETFGGIAQNLVVSSFYDLGLYFPYQYPAILRAITQEGVLEAAQQTLHPEGYVAVIAGPVEGSG